MFIIITTLINFIFMTLIEGTTRYCASTLKTSVCFPSKVPFYIKYLSFNHYAITGFWLTRPSHISALYPSKIRNSLCLTAALTKSYFRYSYRGLLLYFNIVAFSTRTSIIWPSFKSETGEREVEFSENAFATELNISQSERAPASASRRRSRLQRACAERSPFYDQLTTQPRNQNRMREAWSDDRPEQSPAYCVWRPLLSLILNFITRIWIYEEPH